MGEFGSDYSFLEGLSQRVEGWEAVCIVAILGALVGYREYSQRKKAQLKVESDTRIANEAINLCNCTIPIYLREVRDSISALTKKIDEFMDLVRSIVIT